MFSKATANFVRQIDPEGSLIHVSRVNDSQKLVPMALVVKRNRIWFWQKPKYQPTDFTLGDLLKDGKVLSPGVSETEFLSYEGTFGDELSAAMDTEAGPINVTVQGRGSSKLQSCFGKLKKEELDVKKLLRDSSNRPVDMQHVLVQQLERRAEVLAVVKERILTTNPCSITQKKTEQCSFHGMLKLAGMLSSSVQVCVKDGTGIEVDSDVSLEIPSGTVIAYSILELEIKKNGHYDICLQPGTVGGIESDIPVLPWPSHESLDMADGKCNLSSLQNGSQDMDLSPLEQLPQPSRCDVFKRLQEILRDRPALSCLQYVLEELCSGETPTMQQELSESQTQSVSAILDRLVSADGHDESSRCGMTAYLNAAHLLVSALEELPDETLSLLSDSSPESLEAFDTLMCMLKDSGAQVSIQCPPLLQDNQAFQLAEQLLRSVGVALRRHGDGLWMEAGNTAGVVRLVLCLSTHGLSLLCKGLK